MKKCLIDFIDIERCFNGWFMPFVSTPTQKRWNVAFLKNTQFQDMISNFWFDLHPTFKKVDQRGSKLLSIKPIFA